jgi:cytochrome c oxidase subunit 1
MYSNRWAYIAWGFIFAGFNLMYFPQFIIGVQGMPRRYFDYLPQFQWGHFLSGIGAVILITGLILMVWNLVYHKTRGAIAPANPWKGVTLEWQIASPPPVENFDEIPVIKHKPYWFGKDTD